ncbi:MAG: hypothetical protein HUK06_08690 [Bacteroidaceae bacterium]|nr:hypothetical protein [Bacteroidaceae bacterium]
MKRFKLFVLTAACALSGFTLTSCVEEAPELNYSVSVTVNNDFQKLIEAINANNKTQENILAAIKEGNTKNEESIKNLIKAIDDMRISEADKLAVIEAAIKDASNTIGARLAALQAAVENQTLSLEGKLNVIAEAIKAQTLELAASAKKIADAQDAAAKLVASAIDNMSGSVSDKLNAINSSLAKLEATLTNVNASVKEQTEAIKAGSALIDGAIKAQTLEFKDKLELLISATATGFQNQAEAITNLNNAVSGAINSQTNELKNTIEAFKTALDGRLGEVIGKLELIKSEVATFGEKNKVAIDLLTTAINNFKGSMEDKLGILTQAVKDQTTTLDSKLDLIQANIKSFNTDMNAKFDLIAECMNNNTAAINNQTSELVKFKEAVTLAIDSARFEIDTLNATVDHGFNIVTAQVTGVKNAIKKLTQQQAMDAWALRAQLGNMTYFICGALQAQTWTLAQKLDAIGDGLEAIDETLVDIQHDTKTMAREIDELKLAIKKDLVKAIEDAAKKGENALGQVKKAINDLSKQQKQDAKDLRAQIETMTTYICAALEAQAGTLAEKLDAISDGLSAIDETLVYIQHDTETMASEIDEIKLAIKKDLTKAIEEAAKKGENALGAIKTAIDDLSKQQAKDAKALRGQLGAMTTFICGALEAQTGALATKLNAISGGLKNIDETLDLINKDTQTMAREIDELKLAIKIDLAQSIAEAINSAVEKEGLKIDDIVKAITAGNGSLQGIFNELVKANVSFSTIAFHTGFLCSNLIDTNAKLEAINKTIANGTGTIAGWLKLIEGDLAAFKVKIDTLNANLAAINTSIKAVKEELAGINADTDSLAYLEKLAELDELVNIKDAIDKEVTELKNIVEELQKIKDAIEQGGGGGGDSKMKINGFQLPAYEKSDGFSDPQPRV